jgi:hypothetical protein
MAGGAHKTPSAILFLRSPQAQQSAPHLSPNPTKCHSTVVILSVAKDPEGLHPPQPAQPFSTTNSIALSLLLYPADATPTIHSPQLNNPLSPIPTKCHSIVVILSVAKDPEGLHPRQPLNPFQRPTPLPCRCFFIPPMQPNNPLSPSSTKYHSIVVILSVAKDPEDPHPPQPLNPFSTTNSIVLAVASYPADATPKPVKPKNHLNSSKQITSTWHTSFRPTVILKL